MVRLQTSVLSFSDGCVVVVDIDGGYTVEAIGRAHGSRVPRGAPRSGRVNVEGHAVIEGVEVSMNDVAVVLLCSSAAGADISASVVSSSLIRHPLCNLRPMAFTTLFVW